MIVHGVGSVNSPIVISDDDSDEAYVELELEQRLSSPQEGMELGFEGDYQPDYAWQDATLHQHPLYHDEQPKQTIQDVTPDGRSDHGMPRFTCFSVGHIEFELQTGSNDGAVAGQKRKRDSNSVSPSQRLHPLPAQTLSVKPRLPSPGAPPGESKTARKKRRKRERQAAEAVAQAVAGPSTGASHPLPAIPAMPPPMSPVSPVMPSPTSSVPFLWHASLPPKPMLYPDFPLSLSPMPLQNMQASPMSLFPPPPPPPPPIPSAFLNIHAVPRVPPELHIVPQEPQSPPKSEAEPAPKVPTVKKPIGMPPDADPSSHHGTYKSPSGTLAPPNPARTLVLELLPKKFRSLAFVRSWGMGFGPRPPVAPRVDLDVKSGKALIEFATADVARSAWESDRMLGEGREHIRVYWYRVPGIGADAGVGELEEGEIEDGELAKHAGKKNKTKTKEAKKKAVEPTLPPVPVVPPSHVNGRRVSISQAPPTPSMSSLPPMELMHNPRHPTLPHVPASLPPKPVSFMQPPVTKPAAPQHTQPVPVDPPKALLARIQPASSNPVEVQQISAPLPSQPTPSVSSLNATAPVFVPKAQSHSSTPATVEVVQPSRSMDVSSPPLKNDVPDTPSAKAIYGRDGATPEAVHSALVEAMFGSHSDHVDNVDSAAPSRDNPQPPDVPSIGAPAVRQRSPSWSKPTTATSENDPAKTEAPSTMVSVAQAQSNTFPLSDSYIGPLRRAKKTARRSKAPIVKVVEDEDEDEDEDKSENLRAVSLVPTPPPTEPRATRNAPKVPSFAKRKEVEARLARHREELAARSSASSSGSSTPVSEIEAVIMSKPSTPTNETTPSSTTLTAVDVASAMKEDDLRRLVLSSRKSRAASTTPSTPSIESRPSFVTSVTISEVEATTMAAPQGSLSLDELAVSFIAQSIQAVSAMPSPAPNAPNVASPVSPIFSEKAMLAAKQNILETNIADQKELMKQYLAAHTKADRDRLKRAMAERSRYVPTTFSTQDIRGGSRFVQSNGTGAGSPPDSGGRGQGGHPHAEVQVA